jgi:16S rRNA processing protein RimM
MVAPDAWVPLAEVARPHGVRGEMRLRPFNRDSDLLLELEEVLLRPAEGAAKVMRVEGVRRANDAILLKLYSLDDRDEVAALRAALVCARRAEFPPLEKDEFYACDVEGARVVVGDTQDSALTDSLQTGKEATPTELGRVTELRHYPTVDVLVVEASDGGRAWEVPLVDDVVKQVDIEGGVVVLSTLEGVERE